MQTSGNMTRTHHKLTFCLDMELLSIQVGNQKCRIFQDVDHNGDYGHGSLKHSPFDFQGIHKSPADTHGMKQPKLCWPSTWPKTWGLSYQCFFGSECLQSLFVFLFTFLATSCSCFLKHLPSHKTYQGSIMLLIHSWADVRCVAHLWLGWWWIPAAWELWMWLFVTQGGSLSNWQ